MKIRTLVGALLGLAFLALPVFATSFGGTFTQTVTISNNNSTYTVGESFTGSYRYDSATIDGQFYPAILFVTPPGVNNTLTGGLYFALEGRPATGSQAAEHPLTGFQPFTTGVNGGSLTVSGGQVSNFFWSFENGGYYVDGSFSGGVGTFHAMSYYDRPIFDPGTGQFLPTPFVSGTLTFSAPTEIPDSGSPTWMVLACVSGLSWAAARRRKARGFSEELAG